MLVYRHRGLYLNADQKKNNKVIIPNTQCTEKAKPIAQTANRIYPISISIAKQPITIQLHYKALLTPLSPDPRGHNRLVTKRTYHL